MTLENVVLKFRLGDTWASPEWAVLVDDLPVDLVAGGWSVLCQARRSPDSPPVQEWSLDNDRVQIGLADVSFGNTGEVGETSTIQLRHSAFDSNEWDPFSADFEIEIERGSDVNVERHTIVSGRITALQDVTD